MTHAFWGRYADRRIYVHLASGFLLFLFLFGTVPGAVRAQDVPAEVEAISDALDVPFVPSAQNVLKNMFDMVKITKHDFVIDLGSGDGRIVIAAAKQHGARGFGVDLNQKLVAIANERARRQGVADRAKFHVRDIFKTDISQATVLTMYLLPEIVLQLRSKLLSELKPGTRVLSHDYHLAEWRPEDIRIVNIGQNERSIVYSWIVPASVKGSWTWDLSGKGTFDRPQRFETTLRQQFQDFSGDVDINGMPISIREAALTGDKISFSLSPVIEDGIVRMEYRGTVKGDEIVGTVRVSGSVDTVTLPWRAKRTKGPRG